MLLSRYAESLYWAGRYLERAEATARMITVHTELFLDLPRAAGVGWSPLLAVAGCSDEFLGRHAGPDEEDVVAYLAGDVKNLGSIVASVAQARSNLRVARVLLPNPCWEIVNELHGRVCAGAAQATHRRTRLAWMNLVIGECQRLTGALAGTMCDDEAYAFLQLGRFLERADMTTRVLDVQAGILVGQVGAGAVDDGGGYADVTWVSVLKSLSAHQMFRRSVGTGPSGPAALRFLLQDPRFPRSVEYCLSSAARALPRLPRAAIPLAACAAVRRQLVGLEIPDGITPVALHELVDRLQLGIGALNDALSGTFFRLVLPAGAEPDASEIPAELPVKAS